MPFEFQLQLFVEVIFSDFLLESRSRQTRILW
jgi:hypothetical protein